VQFEGLDHQHVNFPNVVFRSTTTCAEESQVVGKNPTCPTAEILELKKTKPEREEERGILRKKSGDLIRSDSPCDWETFFQRNLELQALAHLLILHPLFPPPCS
jgi:hypothetical protein